VTTDYGAANWDATYTTLANYRNIEKAAKAAGNGENLVAIAKIMQSFHFQRLVDIYGNVPYKNALNGGTDNFPVYDEGKDIYPLLVDQIDSALVYLKNASGTAINPGSYDIMFKGTMSKWVLFANTVKLKLLMRMTETAGGPAYIKAKLAGLKSSDFLVAGQDAAVNPGYSNSTATQQSPFWSDFGYTTTGNIYAGRTDYYRASSYAVNFYKSTNDPRLGAFYIPNTLGNYQGRAYGSVNAGVEHNDVISGVGGNATGKTQTIGVLKSASQDAIILPATESLFLQAEAAQRGFLPDNPVTLFQSAVSESFRLLGITNYTTAATTYTGQSNDLVNYTTSSNKLKTIITQKWAALNTYDPLESWSDWRRLGIPSDLPVSVYTGTTATHIPYRLPYPTSEYSYNPANVKAQGDIKILTSKIFWMP
jgi:hypothetical protein